MCKKSLSLVEMVTVITIIVIIAAIVILLAMRQIENSKIVKAHADFRVLQGAIAALEADTGQFPTDDTAAGQPNCYFSIGQDPNDLLQDYSGWPGWDGPYIEDFSPMHPWGGTYYICGHIRDTCCDWQDWDGHDDIVLEFEDYCYPTGPNGACPIPLASGLKLDRIFDDGVQNTGDVIRMGPGDWHWLIVHDIYE
jgi:hypothetical protein